jgi:DNA repair protein RadC
MKNNIINEVALYYPNPEINEPVFIKNSNDAHNILRRTFNEHQLGVREEFVVLYLNRSNQVLGSYCGFKGGITGVVVDVRLIFSIALKCLAVSIILAHNHPSGSLTPSNEDGSLTLKVKEAGEFLDINLLDHLIINTRGEYLSFADKGML